MRRGLAPAIAVALLAAGPATAHMVLGAGTTSCGQWLADQQVNDPNAVRYFDKHVEMEWVLGYLTAFNAGAGEAGDITAGLGRSSTATAITGWLSSRCLSHPGNDLSEAADELIRALGR